MPDTLEFLARLLPTAAIPTVATAFALWKADAVLSDDGAKLIYNYISQTLDDPTNSKIEHEVLKLLRGYLSFDRGAWRFFRNVFVFTACSLAVMLCIYAYEVPDIVDEFPTEGFLSQFFLDGFLKTFAVNAVAFAIYSLFLDKLTFGSARQTVRVIALDFMLKLLLFLIATGLIYVAFSQAADSFGGKSSNALAAIPATLALAVRFKDLTAVYLYSVWISSFPIFLIALIRLMARDARFSRVVRGMFFFLPFKDRPVRAMVTVLALFVGSTALVASLIFH